MERQQCNLLQNFDDSKTDILKKRLLRSENNANNLSQNNLQQNVLLNSLRTPISSSMIVSSMQAPQSSIPITHNLVTHSIAPVKIHANNSTYPLQLSTVHVPVQIPGSNSNINVPVQLSGPASSVPLQITPVSLPIQVSGSARDTINVPLQLPAANQNIQLTNTALPSMPILQGTNQTLHSSIIHVHMGSNPRMTNIDRSADLSVSSSSQIHLSDPSGVQVKMNNPTTVSQVQLASNPTVLQIPNSSNNSIQLTLPNSSSNTVQLRGSTRTMPHVVYIQTPTGLKAVNSAEVISQASTSGNPPQIIVRRPMTNNSSIQLISNVNKPNITPKLTGQKTSLLNSNSAQPIVIQKPKSNEKLVVPVSIAPHVKPPTFAYLGPVKKKTLQPGLSENQSILISNNQSNLNSNSQKLFLTPMNVPKIPNTKFILPVTLPATMASKGPIINLQIANGQIQNDPQGNITVMRDTGSLDSAEMPPLQPLGKNNVINGKDVNVSQSPKSDKSFTVSISGSRAEPTGEQGEYTLSIPETNASMNDDVYTVSIADGEGGLTREQSFTLAIPEKGKSLLNKNVMDKSDLGPVIAAPAILRRSNSDNSEKQSSSQNYIKRRISLCDNLSNKSVKLIPMGKQKPVKQSADTDDADMNDDHRVPSLFCDEQLDKELDAKGNLGDSDVEDKDDVPKSSEHVMYAKNDFIMKDVTIKQKRESTDAILEEDPPGLIWSNGTALLQGSNLRFRTNEFGLIDLIDIGSDDVSDNPRSKYHTPLKQRILNVNKSGREKKPTSPEDLYSCDGCGCHGMAAEFITPNFCSLTCQSDTQKLNLKKKERERIELVKKRNKMKRFLLKHNLSEPDMTQENREDKVTLKHYDSTPVDSQLSDTNMHKISEDLIENEKYPWMCGKNGFSWMRYLEICKAKAAPVKLFRDPFPYNRNLFKVGMRMEAIDPQNPSLFCVVSVAEVQGYRMRLHFDEYPDLFDYWVNADCIDIFPAGWCEKNSRQLKPPAGITPASFFWPLYLKQKRAIAAPRHLFPHITTTMIKPNGFRIGMKLEAEDRTNEMVCVATIADMLENRMLINFDSWDEMYDFWVDPTSPYIHAVGWAEENDIMLTPPNSYKDPSTFSWEEYLSETGSVAAPPRAFKTRPPAGFKTGMKLEVVDRRVPFLIRVASITSVKGHQLRISFDGWPDELSFWLDDDSPDIHPVGWCLKTGHPLEPPLTAEDLRSLGPCGVGGCRGLGSTRGGSHKQHVAATTCPYRAVSPDSPPHRLQGEAASDRSSRALSKLSKSDMPKEKLPRGRPPKHKRVEEVKNDHSDDESVSSSGGKRWRSSMPPRPIPERPAPEHPAVARPAPPCPANNVAKHAAALHLPRDPAVWTQSDVSALLSRLAGADVGKAASHARLCGQSLLMASCDELVSCLRLRLGPAIKVYSGIRQLREGYT